MEKELAIREVQIRRIHVLLTKLDKMAYKRDYVDVVSNYTKESTTQLTHDEANAMILQLERELNDKNITAYNNRVKAADVAADAMRKKIISQCRECGWLINGKADMKRVYAWVLKYGYLHKPLMQYTAAELPALVTQAVRMKESFLNAD